jgi:hypothetical protein
MPNLRGLFYLIIGAGTSRLALHLWTLLGSATLMAWAAWKRLPFELMVVVAVLVGYHGYIHDSVLLLIPLLTCQISDDQGDWRKVLAWGALALGPSFTFANRVPDAFLAVVYLAFLVVMAKSAGRSTERLPDGSRGEK